MPRNPELATLGAFFSRQRLASQLTYTSDDAVVDVRAFQMILPGLTAPLVVAGEAGGHQVVLGVVSA